MTSLTVNLLVSLTLVIPTIAYFSLKLHSLLKMNHLGHHLPIPCWCSWSAVYFPVWLFRMCSLRAKLWAVTYILMDPVWEAVSRLERQGIRVLALTCDGASPNRRFWKLQGKGKEMIFKIDNLHAPEGVRSLFLCQILLICLRPSEIASIARRETSV